MSYCTLALLSAAKLAQELAQVATPERYPVVDDALMDATLLGSDRSAFDPADVAIADEAAAHVQSALDDARSEEHTSELQSQSNLVCRLLLEKKKNRPITHFSRTGDDPLNTGSRALCL